MNTENVKQLLQESTAEKLSKFSLDGFNVIEQYEGKNKLLITTRKRRKHKGSVFKMFRY